jgi:hypothetical protein
MRFALMVSVFLFSLPIAYAVELEPDSALDLTTPQENPKGRLKTFVGKPVFIDGSSGIIAVQNNNNKRLQFVVPDTARITKNGVPVSVNKLDKKVKCTVTYRKQNRLLFCLAIKQ